MLRKKFRLPIATFPRHAEIILRNKYFLVKSSKNNLIYNRLGVTFKAKDIKKATKRNNIKRILFDFFQKEKNLFDQTSHGVKRESRDYLFILNKNLSELPKTEIESVLNQNGRSI